MAIAVASAACSGGGSKAAVATTTSATVKTATVTQVASVVAEHEAPMRPVLRAPEDCSIEWDDLCPPELTTLKYTADTLSITLTGIDDKKPRNGLYIGAIPAELQQLVTRTKTALAGLKASFVDFDTACLPNGAGSQVCTEALFSVQQTTDQVVHVLDAWQPYTGAPAEEARA